MIKCFKLSASFAVWLIKEMTKIISGYIERVNEKAVVAYYETKLYKDQSFFFNLQ